MIIKPNRAIGQKARYEEVNLEFYNQTCKITLTNKNKAEENGTLKEIKWITKDMIHTTEQKDEDNIRVFNNAENAFNCLNQNLEAQQKICKIVHSQI